MPEPATRTAGQPVRWAKLIDHDRCIGCHACTTACKSENEVPLSVTRTYVKYVEVGVFPQSRRAFQVTRCNQCERAPCATACPTGAMFRRADGIVDFDKSVCIGCKACIAACPYDAIFINPEDHSAEKCNFCAHRLDVGLEPACVSVCPTEAILVGDLEDPGSRVSQLVHRDAVSVRRPEKETRPKLFYKGGHQATLLVVEFHRDCTGVGGDGDHGPGEHDPLLPAQPDPRGGGLPEQDPGHCFRGTVGYQHRQRRPDPALLHVPVLVLDIECPGIEQLPGKVGEQFRVHVVDGGLEYGDAVA